MDINGLVAAHLREENREIWERDDIWVPDFSGIVNMASRLRTALRRDSQLKAPEVAHIVPAE